MTMTIAYGAVFPWLAFCIAAAAWTIRRAWPFLYVDADTDINTDAAAIKHFQNLLDDAEEKMAVYDDGNDMEGSLYQDEGVIEAVRRKLDEKEESGFRMQCFFNFDDPELPFRKAFEGDDRVALWVIAAVMSGKIKRELEGRVPQPSGSEAFRKCPCPQSRSDNDAKP